jgi:hypothetical protein
MIRFVSLALALVAAAPVAAAPPEVVRCSFDDGPAVPCRFSDTADRNGVHRMTFTAAGKRMEFVGKSQSGWWAGRLNGASAMGFERNRGNVVFSSYDGRLRFAWWYPANEHGTY